MAVTAYPFQKVCDADRLTLEIQNSSIVTALDGIQVQGGWTTVLFRAALSSPDVTTIDTLVSNHVATPLPFVTAPTAGPDQRPVVAPLSVPVGYTQWQTGAADNIAAGTAGRATGGAKLQMVAPNPAAPVSVTFQLLNQFYFLGGRVLWDGASNYQDSCDAFIWAPATLAAAITGSTGGNTGNLDKTALGGAYHMLVPNQGGTGAFNFDPTSKLNANVQILAGSPVPNAAGTGWWDYSTTANTLLPNYDQQGGYDLYDFPVKLFRAADTIYGRASGGESVFQAINIVGKCIPPQWTMVFTLNPTNVGAVASVIMTVASTKNT
jgi:hypothetical protein